MLPYSVRENNWKEKNWNAYHGSVWGMFSIISDRTAKTHRSGCITVTVRLLKVRLKWKEEKRMNDVTQVCQTRAYVWNIKTANHLQDWLQNKDGRRKAKVKLAIRDIMHDNTQKEKTTTKTMLTSEVSCISTSVISAYYINWLTKDANI